MRSAQPSDSNAQESEQHVSPSLIPSISLPKGGGAIRGIGEKFGANPVTGTGSMALPIFASAHRFGPTLGLSYDSGNGNGPFGLGWNLSVPAVSRKTEKGLPRYRDAEESDVFVLSEAEDLVPVLMPQGSDWAKQSLAVATYGGLSYRVQRYRPRIEGLFARIERWTSVLDGSSFWKCISKDNVTSLYGVSGDARIADPQDPTRIFKWLLQYSYDDKGNVVVYEYKADNEDNVPVVLHESNRIVGAQRYLKYVRYGNTTPYYPDASVPASQVLPAHWSFHLAFDYGEHHLGQPRIEEDASWPTRTDPFSTYRAGFEIRSHRLCRRVLMFHEFAELGTTPCLIRSTDFTYEAGSVATLLTAARQTAYRRNPLDQSYTIADPQSQEALSPRAMPPIEFTYSKAVVDETLRFVAEQDLANLPAGVDGTSYQWLDLDGEGLPGILTEQSQGWFYKRNISNLPRDDQGNVLSPDGAAVGKLRATFDPVQSVATIPSLAALAGGRQQFVDLAGEGHACLVQFEQPISGYYERDEQGEWQRFVPFANTPNINWSDPSLKTLDLDGDGRADILISGDEVFTWYPSLGKEGFAPAESVRKPFDENLGPALVFADGTQSIFLADFSGDGLTDLVRIRNGEVCYWPNLGYGRFGAKVAMSHAPVFDTPDQFDQKRIRLADVDGSGTTDILYLGRDAVSLYFNQAGNAWSAPHVLTQFPAPDNLAAVAAVDLLGNGTACLVWSSPLPGDAGRQMRYVDLMGGQKPHLLVGIKNNLGAETRVHYVASTQFYLQDRFAGTPWITKLPFPVHVVDRVEVNDAISKTRFVSRYAYHHGYYDGAEREFRGFGLVEQWDTEAFAALSGDPAVNLDQATALPAVLTRTWFHTGAYLQGARISLLFKDQYYCEPGLSQAQRDAMLLSDTVLPTTVTLADGTSAPWHLCADEEREACRSLKGATLRQEIYALDGAAQASQPYSVSECNLTIQLLQPKGENRHAVFFTHARETVDYHYERKLYAINGQQLADPRVSHAMTLAVDAYGNPLQAVSIGYGRRHDPVNPILTQQDIAKQKTTLANFTTNRYTNAILAENAYRTPLPAQNCTYELLKAVPQANLANVTNLFRFQEMLDCVRAASDGGHDVPYEDVDATSAVGSGPYRRLIGQARTLYRKDDLSGPLPLAMLESLALPHQSYKLACTPGLLTLLGDKISPNDATTLLKSDEGRYQDLDGDGRLWIPSGQTFFSPDPAHPDSTFAREHRYLPQGAQDPFGNLSRLKYDPHQLFVTQTRDALDNTVTAEYDYRVLQPNLVTDPNGNRTAVAFDVLGLVVATALMGKAQEPDGKPKGDSLQGFVPDLTGAQITAFFNDPHGQATALLGGATTRVVYDVHRYAKSGEPTFAASIVRETHVADLKPGEQTRVQVSLSHSDGFGREIQKKLQAGPGPIDEGGASVDPRWVGSGWTVFNNKGKPVKQYEPFFTATHAFEFAVQRGVSPTLFYDPATRVIATLHPDHTYDKVRFDPWWQQTWDVNDTILLDPATDGDVATWFARLDAREYSPSWYALRTDPAHAVQAAQRWPDAQLRQAENKAASKATAHASTPTSAHFDALGRTFLTVADNGAGEKFSTRVEMDIEGNQNVIIDALGRACQTQRYALGQMLLRETNIDSGTRWHLSNATGNLLRRWDERDQEFRFDYDPLHRSTTVWVTQGAAPKKLFELRVYGEAASNAIDLNLRTRPIQSYDGAGQVKSIAFDFKGNLVQTTRRLATTYQSTPDWSSLEGLADPSAVDAVATALLEKEIFTSSSTFDALNRVTSSTSPDASVLKPTYNQMGLLQQVDVHLRGASTATPFVANIEYDAKGQRAQIDYGNGASTVYTHDELTFRLVHLQTTRSSDNVTLQDLNYTFDPVGNIVAIADRAQQVLFFKNQVVTPSTEYVYDATYRLTSASGREHAGGVGDTQRDQHDLPINSLPNVNDATAVRNYLEQYVYDAVGNFLQFNHTAVGNSPASWTRRYQYQLGSNRLQSTSLPGDPIAGPYSAKYPHDAHGSILRMPHLASIEYDYRDKMARADLGGGGTAYYVYDASGTRVRKVVDSGMNLFKERIYLGGYEIYRERNSSQTISLERQTLHIADGAKTIAMAETKTIDSAASNLAPISVLRFQLGNHLESALLECDENGQVFSYEEYHPYGTSAYRAGTGAVDISDKRYRYCNAERDDETGFYCMGQRYYCAWLASFSTSDPIGLQGGVNLYAYVRSNPIRLIDLSGTQPSGIPGETPPPPHETSSYEDWAQTCSEELHTPCAIDESGQPAGPWIGYTQANPESLKKPVPPFKPGEPPPTPPKPVPDTASWNYRGTLSDPLGTYAMVGDLVHWIGHDQLGMDDEQLDPTPLLTMTPEGLPEGLAAAADELLTSTLKGTLRMDATVTISAEDVQAVEGARARYPNYVVGNTGGAFGVTDKFGEITVSPGLSAKDLAETLRHEGVHSWLSPIKGGAFQEARADFGAWAYNNLHLVRYLEEAAAETNATRSLGRGLSFPLNPGYKISLPRLGAEGVLYGGIVGGPSLYVLHNESKH